MKKIVGLIAVVILIVAGKKGMALFEKFRHANRLQIGVEKFKLLNLSSQINSSIILTVGNFSPSSFIIDQINVNAYTATGELLAKQVTPLRKPLLVRPNQNNILPLTYKINTPVVVSELKKIGGVSSVLANFLTSGKNGLPIVLKGFVSSGTITKEINNPITV